MLKKIRNYKLPYMIYNFFNKKKLQHNIPLYKKYGLDKSYFSSISSKDFAHLPENERKFNDQKLFNTEFYKNLSEENKTSAEGFDDNGFLVLRNYLKPETADQINDEIEKLMKMEPLNFVMAVS